MTMRPAEQYRSRTSRPLAALGLITSLSLALSACSALGLKAAPPLPIPTGTALPAATTPATDSPVPSATVPTVTLPESTDTPQPPTVTPVPTPTPTYRSSFPNPAGFTWSTVVSRLDLPVDVQNARDGSGRLFVVEKSGRIVIVQNGQELATPFLDIRSEVGSQNTEQGLLGLAFHPDYAGSGLFFVNYTDVNGDTVIAAFHVSAGDPNRADPATQVDLLHVRQPYANHNGGGLAFGPDGYLYIGLGDGGSAGDPQRNGQNLDTELGKLLRINVDGGEPYTIPSDNPFALSGGLPEIWAYGLRNPWRFSFDRLTGDLYIGDVGQDTWEEVDYVRAGTPGGLNFGWSYYEASHPYHPNPPANATFTFPVVEYSHDYGCAITGGYVYRGAALPEWRGVYLYADYCSGTVWGLIQTASNTWQTQVVFNTGAHINTFGQDEAGELYLVDYNTGTLFRLGRLQ
jgi:glucose/arabinose dehydrogenase